MTDKKTYEHFEEVYKGNRDDIPWNNIELPELLVKLVKSGQIKVGRVLDLGSGLGNYAIWLAKKGFEVVGLDASPTAIKIAKRNAEKKNVKCRFMVADLTGKWPGFVLKELRRGRPDLRGKLATAKRSEAGFDFVYDWGLLHHIPFSKRLQYVKNVHRVLKPEGKYVSVCFNVKDTAFEGRGKKRKTQLGTFVYLSSKPELRKLFGRFFKIIDFRVLKIQGRIMSHVFNYCFMEKKTNH